MLLLEKKKQKHILASASCFKIIRQQTKAYTATPLCITKLVLIY